MDRTAITDTSRQTHHVTALDHQVVHDLGPLQRAEVRRLARLVPKPLERRSRHLQQRLELTGVLWLECDADAVQTGLVVAAHVVSRFERGQVPERRALGQFGDRRDVGEGRSVA